MHKWLWIALILVPVMWLSGCGGTDTTLTPGEGTGVIETTDFDPFGTDAGPLHLRHFTVPASGTYQVILSSGPDQPALPEPWMMLFFGTIDETNASFFAAYDNGFGVLKQSHGTNIAQVTFKAQIGREYTFSFGSWTGDTGAYSWRVTRLR